ncbi:MAG: right-handed parallel beta-helix repeat-containing protein, partial [Draconibacterium sp.]|nr:right-handed parallel beta-helix repeat-containing protein [Draconibacterium sp.]
SSKSGYVFKGWANETTDIIVREEEVWKYNDKGEESAANWNSTYFNDEIWNSGKAELGYGDGDENTILSYGNSSKNKQITTYFRKTFSVENSDGLERLKIRLKCDDGAVVYLNGTEVVRENLPSGEIGRKTKALSAVGGLAEDDFTTYLADKNLLKEGKNSIAVEIHQYSGTSSDISFDLELSAISVNLNELFSTNRNLKFIHSASKSLVAVFENDGSCILPGEITTEVILNKACSPYKVPNIVKITTAGKLVIEPGVELWMSDNVSMEINGKLLAKGTEEDPIIFRSDENSINKKWGILNFVNADTSLLSNVIIENASSGDHPIREIAAVSAFHSVLTLDGVIIENVHNNPVVARYSSLKVVNSRLHSKITGDLINVKYGKGFIENCRFTGSDLPDTDAIDFDNVTNGIIRNCVISGFMGSNSDGIDIGEKAKNIQIENVVFYNITDKGISVGQQSSAIISNSVFVNCDKGIGLKDSSRAIIDHCTFYGNQISVACFEKNVGNAGGNAVVTNSILSNVYDTTYFSDAQSTIKIINSASDNTALPTGKSNLFTDPQFINPNLFDFSLTSSSPCIGAATDGNMGADLTMQPDFNQPFISAVAYRSDIGQEIIEFLVLSNSGEAALNISGYEFTKGITFRFPENTMLNAGHKIYISNNANTAFWEGRGAHVFEWENGRLADEGEVIQLKNKSGIIIDKIRYNSDNTWPEVTSQEGIILVSDKVDNHFGSNWRILSLDEIVGLESPTLKNSLTFYPNPTTGIIYISGLSAEDDLLNIYNLSGIKVISEVVNSTHSEIDLQNLPQGIYLLQCRHSSNRVVLRR